MDLRNDLFNFNYSFWTDPISTLESSASQLVTRM
jgi:hypothetical protein